MVYILSAFLSIAGAFLMSRFGAMLGFIDYPNERSSHAGLIPKGGAAGILVSFICVSVLLGVKITFYVPVALASLAGLISDRVDISPRSRLLLQFICSSVLVLGAHSAFSAKILWIISVIFFIVFIAGTANVYNFMDGINGIAGIAGVIGFALLAFFAFNIKNNVMMTTLCLCMAFSCVGFLPFNFPRARVFMGDVGSVLLGFLFASTTVLLAKSAADFICLGSFLFLFYADEVTTMYVRLRDRENLILPHRKHLYQLLSNEMKIPHWIVSFGYGVCQILIGIGALLLWPSAIAVATMLLACFIVFVAISCSVRMKCRLAEA